MVGYRRFVFVFSDGLLHPTAAGFAVFVLVARCVRFGLGVSFSLIWSFVGSVTVVDIVLCLGGVMVKLRSQWWLWLDVLQETLVAVVVARGGCQ
ncbi:hypothetical protein P8452_45976 [Trifolium repens]|jgi:hypothetical protein|nr:hypothetical protein P8452_45976 [Trifolium repens]